MKNRYVKANTKYKANRKLTQEQFEYQLKKALEEGTEKNIQKKNRDKSYATNSKGIK